MWVMNDAELIRHLGGPTKVSALLGYKKHGVQRVQNWIGRGIPASVKIKFPHIFLRDMHKPRKRAAMTAGAVAPQAETTEASTATAG